MFFRKHALFYFFFNALIKTMATTDSTSSNLSTNDYESWDKKIADQNQYFESIFEIAKDIIHSVQICMYDHKKECISCKNNTFFKSDLLLEKVQKQFFNSAMTTSTYTFTIFCYMLINFTKNIFLNELKEVQVVQYQNIFIDIFDLFDSILFRNLIYQIKNNRPNPRIWSRKNWIKQLLCDATLEYDAIENIFEPGSLKYFSIIMNQNVISFSRDSISKIFTNDFNHPDFSMPESEKEKVRNFLLNDVRLGNIINLAWSVLHGKNDDYEKHKRILKVLEFEI